MAAIEEATVAYERAKIAFGKSYAALAAAKQNLSTCEAAHDQSRQVLVKAQETLIMLGVDPARLAAAQHDPGSRM